jgi:formate/nitrite transporter FocA (FNT family)
MSEQSSAGSSSPHLEPEEQDQAAAHAAPRALIIHEIVREEGEIALTRSSQALAWSGLAAGLSMGFSFLTQSILRAGLPDTSWRHLVAGLGYSAGFVIVIQGRQQLFTESTLTAVLPVLVRRSLSLVGAIARMWLIVLVANLAGTWAFAALLQLPGVFSADVTQALGDQAAEALRGSFGATMVRAILAGWLIALMVWLLPSARSARLLTILLITYIVAITKLSHIIAGSVEVAYAVLSGAASLRDYFVIFLAPTLIGNTIGGVALVGVLNHAAIAPEIQSNPEE